MPERLWWREIAGSSPAMTQLIENMKFVLPGLDPGISGRLRIFGRRYDTNGRTPAVAGDRRVTPGDDAATENDATYRKHRIRRARVSIKPRRAMWCAMCRAMWRGCGGGWRRHLLAMFPRLKPGNMARMAHPPPHPGPRPGAVRHAVRHVARHVGGGHWRQMRQPAIIAQVAATGQTSLGVRKKSAPPSPARRNPSSHGTAPPATPAGSRCPASPLVRRAAR
jgi:hypothetical protein